MSNLENLTSKILDDSKKKADEILQKAKAEAEAILKEKSSSAQLVKNSYIEKAKAEAESRKQRIISNAELKGRNEKLKVKQEVINMVFNKASEELSKMDSDKFLEFLKTNVSSLNLKGGEEIIISKDFKDAVTKDVLNELNLVLSKENREIPSGFIIINKGIEFNYTFNALVLSLREELEHEVAQMLFN